MKNLVKLQETNIWIFTKKNTCVNVDEIERL